MLTVEGTTQIPCTDFTAMETVQTVTLRPLMLSGQRLSNQLLRFISVTLGHWVQFSRKANHIHQIEFNGCPT